MHQGLLFTREFLRHGIAETSAWNALTDEAVTSFRAAALATFTEFPINGSPNEAQTETDLIFRILEALDWAHYLPQQSASARRRTDVPDALMFAGAEDKARANAERKEAARYKHGIAIVENKAWQLPLDRASRGRDLGDGVPSTQILRYLSLAEVQSDRRIQWGILTNGQHWRLYYQLARSRAEEFLELDLPAILGVQGLDGDLFALAPDQQGHWLRVFILLFRRQAFVETDDDGRTFHQIALDQGRWWEEKVAKDLSHLVFTEVFPALIRGIVENDLNAPAGDPDAAYLDEVKQAALIRFIDSCSFSMPRIATSSRSIQNPIAVTAFGSVSESQLPRCSTSDTSPPRRQHVTTATPETCSAPSATATPHCGCRLTMVGCSILGARRSWNASTFPTACSHPSSICSHARISVCSSAGSTFAIFPFSQLGSIYERLLEFEPVFENGSIDIRLNPFARKDSGSFYTPEELVGLIIEKTVGPLIDEKWQSFEARAKELASDRRPKAERLRQLAEVDPATATLTLKICDPAMGSGHFLVTRVDYLGDRILESVARSEEAVTWAEPESPHESPLIQRIEALRTHIWEQAQRNRWNVPEAQLDDRHLIRRIILKRVVHGVDMNPIELAKVSLWLHTFTVGAPLSFLDHHLRCGNSLYGECVRPVMDDLSQRFRLLINPFVQQAKQAAASVIRIENLWSDDPSVRSPIRVGPGK